MMDVEIAGVGMHPFGRFLASSLKDLGRVAGLRALADAGIGVKDVQAAYSANGLAGILSGQEQIRGQTVLRDMGIESIPVVNVENACASGSSALREAILAVRAGAADIVLALGFEKMYVEDRGATLAALQSAADLDVVSGLGIQFTAVYAMRLRAKLEAGLVTLDQLALAAVKAKDHGSLNPYAQFRDRVTVDQVLASRMIAEPLTLLMCSAISDGAAAAVVARPGVIPDDGRPKVRIRASAARMGSTLGDGDREPVGTLCAQDAYEASGLGADDLDVLEVHDAMAPAELVLYEQLGMCGPGEAGKLLESGETSLGGSRVVNPSGGLSARGHPVGATGLAQIAELTWQLRGEAEERQVDGARLALAHNSGGWLEGDSAACNVHILERVG